METTWTLEGQTTTYTGGFDSDGYKIVASLKWQVLSTYLEDAAATPVAITNTAAVIGTCVETLTEEGTALRPGDVTSGNFAICHWLYYTGLSETTEAPLNMVKGVHWGETRILNEEEWYQAGFLITGMSVQTLGTRLDYNNNGFILSTYDNAAYANG